MEKKRSLTFSLILLFVVGTLPITNPVSADGEVDNWPENDAWLRIELISWSANDSVEWDNDGGLPDPIFKICVAADGDNLDCINTPTWENQLTLNNSWNYSIDIPDNTNILNISIECEDNDALNDDECDMNSDVNHWRLYAEFNWSATPSLTISGDGDDDDDVTWKNAASIWNFTIGAFGDSDSDGVSDENDRCEGFDDSDDFDGDGEPSGCDTDDDNDGILDVDDDFPYDKSASKDTDGDGKPDSLSGTSTSDPPLVEDFDDDNDNWGDYDEAMCDTDPRNDSDVPSDMDGDGICDALEDDIDGDGVRDEDDAFPMDGNEWFDLDGDGVGNNADTDDDNDGWSDVDEERCGSDPYGELSIPENITDDGRCFVGQENEVNGGSESGSAAIGCLAIIIMIGLLVFVVRRLQRPPQHKVSYHQPLVVAAPVRLQSVSIPQISSRERQLENKSRQAQIEAQRLRQELANQAQITQQLQMEAAQKQMSEAALAKKQHELAIAQQEKKQLEAKLAEAEKNTPIVQNITYNITDSAISGDITNKINQDD